MPPVISRSIKDLSALAYDYNIFGNYAFMYDNGNFFWKFFLEICSIIRFQNKKIYVILKRIKVKVCGYGRISDGRTDEK